MRKFHKVHGTNIVLDREDTRATRCHSFCHGITFSALPLELNSHVTIAVTRANEWSGALRLGTTNVDPNEINPLPRYVCPDLVAKEGFWADAIPENLAGNGNRMTFYLTEDGSMQLFINNEHRGAHLSHLPVHQPLWLVLDVYGNTDSVQFVSNDVLPAEIVARGPEATYAFRLAKKCGTLPVFRTRLVLVGQDGAGKSSLKHLLVGHNCQERDDYESENVVTTDWCEIGRGEAAGWLLATEPAENSSTARLPEGYLAALAANIARELLLAGKREEGPVENQESTTTKWLQRADRKHVCTAHIRRRRLANSSRNGDDQRESERSVEQLRRDLLDDLPDCVVEMVDSLLTDQHGQQLTESDQGTSVLLNIWDLSGKAVYHAIHQSFLCSRAIYLLVFNLCQDLDAPVLIPVVTGKGTTVELEEREMTNMEELCFWLNCIRAHATRDPSCVAGQTERVSKPAVIVVGTHKKSLHPDPEMRKRMIDEKFQKIEGSVRGKAFGRHVVKPFFAIDCAFEEDQEVSRLRECIEEVIAGESYLGEEIPIGWLKFEDAVSRLVENGTVYISRQQLEEVARNENIDSANSFAPMLDFYHDLGTLVHFGSSLDDNLFHTVVLDPEWMMDAFGRVFSVGNDRDKWTDGTWNAVSRLTKEGILEDNLLDTIWSDYAHQKVFLVALMEKFDLLCQREADKTSPDLILSAVGEKKYYYVPGQARRNGDANSWFPSADQCVCFYLNFVDFLPASLFHRLVIRGLKWTRGNAVNDRQPRVSSRVARLCLDANHDFLLQMAPVKLARIKVMVTKTDGDGTNENDTGPTIPDPTACARVRHFIESALADIRATWMKRLSYKTCVACTCGRQCFLHGVASCLRDECLHFLSLDECLTNKVVLCDYRRIKTHTVRQHFPSALRTVRPGSILPENSLRKTPYNETVISEEAESLVPRWIKSASKLLNAGSEGNDWTALANKLGYKPSSMDRFGQDLNPGLALIADWLTSSGNSAASIDMLLACLSRIHREDVVDLIRTEQDDHQRAAVFLSYQWDCQDEVVALRSRLERAGFSCWMDLGQMGGGDNLHAKLYEGINGAKVVVACITPKYVVSHACNQEIVLADLLGKPIIPVMIRQTPWPPPGGMALVLARLLYVDFDGSGGHGGEGLHGDWESRFHQLTLRIVHFVDPASITASSDDRRRPCSEPIFRDDRLTSRLSLADLVAYPLGNGGTRSRESLLEEDETTSDDSTLSTPRLVTSGRVQRCTVCSIL